MPNGEHKNKHLLSQTLTLSYLKETYTVPFHVQDVNSVSEAQYSEFEKTKLKSK